MKTLLTPKLVQALFWIVYIPLGLWACQMVGISWDEGIELHTYRVNLEALMGITQGDLAPYQALLSYGDRYYGVGFHIPANAISSIIQFFAPTSNLIGAEAYRITLNHIAIFLSFAGSGFLVGQILKRLTQDEWVSTLGMIACLLWPYLLGHGLMNIKDTPFLFAWLLCTNQAVKISMVPISMRSTFAYRILGIFTGWLISIRISGILIAIEYAVFLIVFWSVFAKELSVKSNPNLKQFSLCRAFCWFGLASGLTLFVCYPILWHNPLEVLNAIYYMSHHPWDGDTLTRGRFIAGTQLYWYLGAWLAVKLPFVALLGLALCPAALYLANTKNKSRYENSITKQSVRAFIALALSMLLILAVLLLKKVILYNELRQILFIFPILLIIAITSLCWVSRKVTIGLLLVSITFFSWDNIKLFPYQYVYFNEIARQFPIAQKYEKDYFGLSATHGARWLNQNIDVATSNCLYASPLHLWQYATDPRKITCVKQFSDRPREKNQIQKNELIEKYFIGVQTRDKFNALPIYSCHLIHSEERTLPLSFETLVMGELYECNPESK